MAIPCRRYPGDSLSPGGEIRVCLNSKSLQDEILSEDWIYKFLLHPERKDGFHQSRMDFPSEEGAIPNWVYSVMELTKVPVRRGI